MSPIRDQLPERVHLREVGPREGFQRGEVVPTESKVAVINGLLEAGVTDIQTLSFVNPKYVPHWADAEDVLRRIHHDPDVTYDALVLNRTGLKRAVTARDDGLPVNHLTMLGGATQAVLNANGIPGTVEEDLEQRLLPLIRACRDEQFPVMSGVSAAFGCSVEGRVPTARVVELVESMVDAGATEIYLSDSTGEGDVVTVDGVVGAVEAAIDVPITIHLHDNRGAALSLITSLLLAGHHHLRFDTALGGVGGCQFIEAAGNVATEDVSVALEAMGVRTGLDLPKLLSVSERLRSLYDYQLAGRATYYGMPRWFEIEHLDVAT